MRTKHDVIIIAVPSDEKEIKAATIRRRYEEHDYDPEIFTTLEEQVEYDTEREASALQEEHWQTIIMNKAQAVKLKRQLEMALNPANDLKIFGTES